MIDWTHFWRHSIGVALPSKELSTIGSQGLDGDELYIAGLLNDVGKLIMYNEFPDQMRARVGLQAVNRECFAEVEIACYGWNHAHVGALYLEQNSMPESIVDAVLHQYAPERSSQGGLLAAPFRWLIPLFVTEVPKPLLKGSKRWNMKDGTNCLDGRFFLGLII